MSELNHSSSYERIFKNLTLLENRNPDLKRLVAFFDMWLNAFVHSSVSPEDGNSFCRNGFYPEKGSVSAPFPFDSDRCSASNNPAVNNPAANGLTSNDLKANGATSNKPVANGVTGFETEQTDSDVPSQQSDASEKSGDAYSRAAETSAMSAYGRMRFVVPRQNAPDSGFSSSAGDSIASGMNSAESAQVAPIVVNLWKAEDIDQLEKRLCLKIEASRWALERDRLLKMSADFQTEIEPRDHALLSRARELTNCYLWMNNPETAPVIATDTYEMLADAYSAAAACVTFMRELIALVDRSPKSEILSRILRDALYITATAQSALRRVTYDVSGREDQDQIRIHRWLTYLTKRYSIYVNRHMKKDSLAPKERIYVIPEYIERLRREVEKQGQHQKILTDGFRRIQYHAGRIQTQNGGDYDWLKIIETVDELVDTGIPANDKRFDEILRPILHTLKEVPPYDKRPFFINVLMQLDFWHENAEEKAMVEKELIAKPPQPSVSSSELAAEEYSSVWDEMERSLPPGKCLDEKARMNPWENQRPDYAYGRSIPGGYSGMQTDSRPDSRVYSAPQFRHEEPGANERNIPRASNWGRYVPSSASEVFGNGISSASSAPDAYAEKSTESTFMNYANARKSQGFGMGILADADEGEAVQKADSAAMKNESGYSRFTGRRGVPSYASVVSEKAHSSHHESDNPAVTEADVAQTKEILADKTIILVEGNVESPLKSQIAEKLGCAVVSANQEQTASENKLAQLVHPGNVGVVLFMEAADPLARKNVESYCRRFDKPFLTISRDSDLASLVRKIKAAMSLWR